LPEESKHEDIVNASLNMFSFGNDSNGKQLHLVEPKLRTSKIGDAFVLKDPITFNMLVDLDQRREDSEEPLSPVSE
jgi:hypothetical protein